MTKLPITPKPSKLTIKIHGTTTPDPYRWFRKDKSFMETYAKDNNQYTLDHLTQLDTSNSLFNNLVTEFKSRTALRYTTVPSKYKSFHYYQTILSKDNYYKYYRTKGNKKTLLLDSQKLSLSHTYWSIGYIHHSPNEQYMAFTVDTTGNETYELYIKDIYKNKLEPGILSNIYDAFVWSNNSQYIYFIKCDSTTRPYQLCILELSTGIEHILYTELDKELSISITNTIDEQFLVLYSSNKHSNKIFIIDYSHDYFHIDLIIDRIDNQMNQIDHNPHGFYLHTNKEGSTNFFIQLCDYSLDHISTIIPHDNDMYLETFYLYKHFMILVYIQHARNIIRFYHFSTKQIYTIPTNSFFVRTPFSLNMDYETQSIRYVETSYNQPKTIYEFNTTTATTHTLYTRTFTGYQPHLYTQQIVSVGDTNIYISMVYRTRKYKQNGKAPGLLSGYGAYGHANLMTFNKYIVSLLDRGFIYAIAHVRGGTENGYQWYEDGKLFNKENSFLDFIECMRFLKQNKYVDPSKLTIMGGSAGGLLIGSVLNYPEIYTEKLLANAVLDVPFVDALSTMLNPKIPLTKLEYTEWGNPTADSDVFHYIKSYSPIQNILDGVDYPNLFIRCGLKDPRVGAWEAMKYIATLRNKKKTNNLLYTLQTGHFGSSKRFDYMREQSFLYGFILLYSL